MLLDSSESWRDSLNQSLFVLLVSLDLRKASDTVEHSVILPKMSCLGFHGAEPKRVRSYLSDETQQTN